MRIVLHEVGHHVDETPRHALHPCLTSGDGRLEKAGENIR
jgi:hypothetical protein